MSFPVLSDEHQSVQKAFGVQNPDTNELALHAVFVLNQQREVVYRKIAGRRPLSQELLDAIDHARGQYPLGDAAPERGDIPVAFPTNNFQALLELANNPGLPADLTADSFEEIIRLRRTGDLDEATIAFREFAATKRPSYSEIEMLDVAAWLTQATINLPQEALLTGQALSKALSKERELRVASNPDVQQLKQAQRELEQLRSVVRRSAVTWRLRGAKTTLRGYRELAKAAYTSETD